MRDLWKEFVDFIKKGNVLMIAVGLVMALYFQQIVNAVLDGIINPLIAAIFGENNFTDIGFNIGDPPPPGEGAGGGNKDISIGLLIDALISFVVVALFLFLVVKAYNRYMAKKDAEETPVTEVGLLTEIRDLLAQRQP